MDKKTLLVLGSVTAAQYSDVRFRMMREGADPKVTRQESSDFLLNDLELLENHFITFDALEKASSEMSDEDRDRLVKSLVDKHLQSFDHPIGAVIMDSSTWAKWNDDEFVYLMDALSVDKWVVHDDGRVEYAG